MSSEPQQESNLTNSSVINLTPQVHTRALGVISSITLDVPQKGTTTLNQNNIQKIIENNELTLNKSSTELIHIATSADTLNIKIEQGVEATIILELLEPNYQTKTNINIQSHAKVQLVTIAKGRTEHEHLQHITLEKTAVLENTALLTGKGKLFFTQQATLLEQTTYTNYILIDECEYLDMKTVADHVGEKSASDTKVRGIVSQKAIVRNLVKIQESADSASGYEKADFLLTNEGARAVSIPDLEIHNHNVSCSHGSTTSNIDKKQLFYLQSRGLSKEQATAMIIQGYKDAATAHLSAELLAAVSELLK